MTIVVIIGVVLLRHAQLES